MQGVQRWGPERPKYLESPACPERLEGFGRIEAPDSVRSGWKLRGSRGEAAREPSGAGS